MRGRLLRAVVIECDRRVSDYAICVARHVSAIAVVKPLGLPAFLLGDVHRRHHRRLAARLLVLHRIGIQSADRIANAPLIELLSGIVGHIVAQIGTGDERKIGVVDLVNEARGDRLRG